MMIPATLNLRQAEARWKCHKQAVLKAHSRGKVHIFRPGRAKRVCVTSGDEWFFSTRLPGSKRPLPLDIPETVFVEEAMKLCFCCRAELMAAVARGEIDAYKPGRRVQFVREHVVAFFHNREIAIKRAGRPRGRRGRRR